MFMKKSLTKAKTRKRENKILKFVLGIFFAWQAVLLIIGVISPEFLPSRERFMYNDGEKIINPAFLWNRANFDGAHYLLISRSGYSVNQQAFFPLYPKLISFFSPLFSGKDLLAALFISNLSFLLALYLFYKLVCLDENETVAKQTLLFWVLFPASFFFGMIYTEGLFVLLALGSFYAARKNKWLLAGVLGALAANTRIIGVFLFPAILYEWWTNYKAKPEAMGLKNKVMNLLSISIIPLGLLSYMRLLWLRYSDALLFIHVQPFFGAERSGGKIILLYQVFWRYLKMILTTRWDFLYFSVWMELLTAIFFIALIYLAYQKKVRTSYLIFSAFSIIIPTLSGTFLSMPRFALTYFPCFIFLGKIANRKLRIIIMSFFALLMVFSTLLFYQGYWVS